MVRFILLLVTIMYMAPAIAGNTLQTRMYTIDSNGYSLGYRSPFILNNTYVIEYDADLEQGIVEEAVNHINSLTVDVTLVAVKSEHDYGHSTEIISFDPRFNKMYSPNRCFIHLGSGFHSQFFATLRVYTDSNPTSFIHLRKSLWIQADRAMKLEIILHEIYHALRWDHPENNPYVDNFDFVSNDNNEVLFRLYDSHNVLSMAILNIVSEQPVGFISAKKKHRTHRTTYTSGNQVKLIPGKYKIQVGDTYIKKVKKNGVIKYTNKLKKAKKFKFKEPINYYIDIPNGTIN